ncbi:MAG: hypothetical protein JWL64_1674 [Frankiales bacterium]|nr:hypothetical protein [Frankiales bacterium]
MKQYLLAVHGVEGAPAPSPEAMETSFAQVDTLNQEMMDKGVWVFAGGLMPPDSATVVMTVNGTTTVTDGPFAQTKEQLGGFWVITSNDLDEAMAWARKASVACMNPIEVRPFQDEPEA